MAKLTVGSLFSGIGGFELGLERTGGFEVRWQVEIDDYCRRVLEKHWPDVKRYGDIRTVTDVERVDLICGGFPCQPTSRAGRRRGANDERWLWPEYHRVLRLARPRLVLLENPPGLIDREIGTVLGDLADIGYDAEWECLPASAFGAEHIRERIFIFAYRVREGLPIRGDKAPQPTNARIFSERIGFTFGASNPGLECRGASRWSGDVHGIPRRMDRVRAIGNSIVPQIAEWIGRRILEAEASMGIG